MKPVEVHRTIEGPQDAPVLILSGSIGSNLDMWLPQRTALSDEYRVVSYDHRGHGKSPVPDGPYTIADLAGDVIALLDQLQVEKAHFCGLSLGGAVGQWLGRYHPHRLDQLVLACTSSWFAPAEAWAERAENVRAKGTEWLADFTLGRWLSPGFADAQQREAVRAMVTSTPADGYISCCSALAAWDFAGELPEIPTPTLAIAGAEDPATPPDHLRDIAAAIPRSRLAVLDGAAHLANVERPVEFNDLLRAHLLG
ncbi:3-oxoadipate enol-lactonase [Kibdelosporangium philippinense]|uniref:3-oxoadipate enol-lactonase n=1 Tax=Kibdelosporangium philippinense TaxID=211113 RepID=A0ABS8ZM73_9PSEU|nr:3-oxoadipate enol-lactonase [Kibdelosporangium philippinense]MCE7007721.1 3-oxoadipate enol-lactonase [Kibdelosporangium philippinense]